MPVVKKEELDATWSKTDNTPRVDVARLRLKDKKPGAGAVENRPRVRIAYRKNKKGNVHASK